MKSIIIQGSSRTNGNTANIVKRLNLNLNSDVVHLASLNIGHFDYEFKNSEDDFLPLIRNIADNYDLIIFATPVYWYTMSGRMKAFFDRLSDCLKVDKETGRKLRGKNMAVVSCGSDPSPTESFFIPFQLSGQYLGMKYLGNLHTWTDGEISKEVIILIDNFCQGLNE